MKFKSKLIEAKLIQRYKRFFADIEYFDSELNKKIELTIHVPNTGSLKSVIEKPAVQQSCWFSKSDDPERKLKGTLEAVQTIDGNWVGVNTSHPNKIVQEMAELVINNSQTKSKSIFKHWYEYSFYKSECKISKETRLDGVFCFKKEDLENPKAKKHYIEIKNTTLKKVVNGQGHAQFPDAVTERGQKHLVELMNLIGEGHKAELIFTIQRSDVEAFSVAEDIDPEYAKLFRQAIKKGLIVTPVLVSIDQTQISLLDKKVPVTF